MRCWSVARRLEGSICGRRISALQQAIEGTSKYADKGIAIGCDVSDESSVAAMFAEVSGRFGRLDLLFNNAGVVYTPASPDMVSSEEWRRVVDTNLTGMFFCLSHAFRQMRHQRPQGGRIINNGSLSSQVPRRRSIAYTAPRHAVTGLTKSASLDGREFGIAVGQIDVGNVASGITDGLNHAEQADGSITAEPRMDMSSVVSSFMTMVRLPPSANLLFMRVMATKIPFVGRG